MEEGYYWCAIDDEVEVIFLWRGEEIHRAGSEVPVTKAIAGGWEEAGWQRTVRILSGPLEPPNA